MTATAQARDAEGLLAETLPRTPRPSWLEAARAFVHTCLADAPSEGVLAITVPAPVAAVESPLRTLRKGPSWIFASSEGPSVAAIGVAMEARASGEDRFAVARDASERMLGAITHRALPDTLTLPVRTFVGFAFAPGAASEAPWATLGDALVTLPRWTYAVESACASLTLVLDVTRDLDEPVLVAELDAVMEAVVRGRPPAPSMPSIVRTDHADRARWSRSIDAIHEAIARGELHKVVSARRGVITTEHDLEPLDVFARLGDTQSASTRFLVRAGSTTFVGATPEHLFVQRGHRIATEALAGSIGADVDHGHDRLLASAKDRDEHAYVVRHIVERLAPLCARIAHPDAPQVRRLPTVLHLRTPIEADLAQRAHPIDVIAALHPTPAVGGTPVERAVPWIVEHELPRGWYGAPLGWIDADGDAEIVVALRCGVIQGARAWLWAGGGIVAGSSPDAEWEEAALKMRPMLRALGAT